MYVKADSVIQRVIKFSILFDSKSTRNIVENKQIKINREFRNRSEGSIRPQKNSEASRNRVPSCILSSVFGNG
ncbi:hypothetical protein TNIN_155441 [Trichonephila inaurata madagascariensis]|uniref:Uncharacterized protein n=1 Tax=Trichonephila inaurata madagascariensis TaxID=2747483 RepID=A0A8X6YY66_9ARAC|nr:hypothetical protein TNIN_155441 [Trichonephila inaurata madagascariensis]